MVCTHLDYQECIKTLLVLYNQCLPKGFGKCSLCGLIGWSCAWKGLRKVSSSLETGLAPIQINCTVSRWICHMTACIPINNYRGVLAISSKNQVIAIYIELLNIIDVLSRIIHEHTIQWLRPKCRAWTSVPCCLTLCFRIYCCLGSLLLLWYALSHGK